MLRQMCKSKIHRATITESNLKYIGSITIDVNLMNAADILPGERVQIVNLNNGTRIETYVMEGKAGLGTICMNGAAARWAEVDDQVIIISYGFIEDREAKTWVPRIVHVNEKNQIVED